MRTNNKVNSASGLFIAAAACFLLISSNIFSQETQKDKPVSRLQNMQGMKMKKHQVSISDTSIVRKGLIDLSAIDKNKDGKVYQDQMDWNVISDKPGKCPLCNMTLKEVTIKEAKKNLIDNGFKVK
jgi:Heavy metal binding domain